MHVVCGEADVKGKEEDGEEEREENEKEENEEKEEKKEKREKRERGKNRENEKGVKKALTENRSTKSMHHIQASTCDLL
ncbi:hypothetical protein SBOR_8453 [Sclerotinia borealis F-4128]|uniref:Uncharacterized protein n=1 Tax=Sclerotinia borealis (strain F-4128) TaxID=1432307 RepID=W9C5K7_SCLBF|nr:hypothetical protein SBOR_8453 [Sclerotinia borealis F-4128]